MSTDQSLEPIKPVADGGLVLSDPTDMFWDSAGFNHALRLGRMFKLSRLVPDHLTEHACAIGVLMARQMRDNPLTVLQAMYVVSGKPGWSAQYVIARAAQCGVFRGPIDWRVEGRGDSLVVTAFALLAASGAEVAFSASMAMAKAEGWTKNPKYQTLPELMLRYRSATLLVRLYAPGVMLGLQTREEIEDAPIDVEATPIRRPAQVILPDPEPAEAPAAHAETPSRGSRLGALGLGRSEGVATMAGRRDDGPTAAEWAQAQVASAEAARQTAAGDGAGEPRGTPAAQPRAEPAAEADARALREGFRGRMTPIPMADVQAGLKQARAIGRLDPRRTSACLSYGQERGWWHTTEAGGAVHLVMHAEQVAAELPPEAGDDIEIPAGELVGAIEEAERRIDPEVVTRISADHIGASELASVPEATLRAYLAALYAAAGV